MSTQLALAGNLTRGEVDAAGSLLGGLLQQPAPLRLDLGAVEAVDSAGAALLADFARAARRRGSAVELVGIHPSVARTLALFPFTTAPTPAVAARPPRRLRLAEAALSATDVLVEFLVLAADVFTFGLRGLTRLPGRRDRLRWSTVLQQMAAMGSQALGVAGLIAFLVGGTVALQSAAQLRQFGANLFVADLIGVAITRELGPLITAIVVAGRSGAAVAAEIGTMVITEEIAALRTMGIHPVRYLIVPKVVAISLTQPLLAACASALAILGGFLVAVLYLDVSANAFVERLQTALQVKDVLTGLFKSLLFANLIVLIGSLCGLRTRGGADAVGRSTTRSVVAAIFAIIVADAACSLLFYFGD